MQANLGKAQASPAQAYEEDEEDDPKSWNCMINQFYKTEFSQNITNKI